MRSLDSRISAAARNRGPIRDKFLEWLRHESLPFSIDELVKEFGISTDRAWSLARFAIAYELVEQVKGTTHFRIIK